MAITPPHITTERLLLRPIISSDLDKIYEGLSHPEVIKYYGVSYDSKEAAKAQMEWFANLEATGSGAWWAICDRNDTRFLGAAGLNNVSAEDHKAELGFWLLPEYQGKGIIREAVPPVYEYGFSQLHLHRIEAWIETGNESSKKTAASLGFSYEGTLHECEKKNGCYISLSIYALLAPARQRVSFAVCDNI